MTICACMSILWNTKRGIWNIDVSMYHIMKVNDDWGCGRIGWGNKWYNLTFCFLSPCCAAPKARSTIPKEVLVDKDGPVLLPCPVRSYHAKYRWEKDNCIKQYPCTISGSSCVLAPTPDLPLKEGVFRCMAEESGLQQEVVSYKLVFNGGPLSTSIASTLGSALVLAAAAHWLL